MSTRLSKTVNMIKNSIKISINKPRTRARRCSVNSQEPLKRAKTPSNFN